eukprot:10528888-Lingulodinium_polyedra.AAC.1
MGPVRPRALLVATVANQLHSLKINAHPPQCCWLHPAGAPLTHARHCQGRPRKPPHALCVR